VELLFWIPLVNWFRHEYGVPPDRITAISRGGADPWYAHIAHRYVDVLDHFDLEDTRRWTGERVAEANTQKQTRVSGPDREVLGRAEVPEGHELLHPSLMHQRFRTFWNWKGGENRLSTVLERSRYEPLTRPAPRPELAARLPERYVAVKSYFNNSFPDTPGNRQLVAELIDRLRAHVDVVLLGTGLELDDHSDFDPGLEGVHGVADLMTPRNNLAVQTEVVAGAEALFATLGGFSYVAAFHGVPSFSFNSDDRFFVTTHRDLMHRAARDLADAGCDAPFLTFPSSVAGVLRELFG